MKRHLINYSICWLAATLIFYLSIIKIPNEGTFQISIPNFDKFVHFMMYFALSATICASMLKGIQACTWKQFFCRLAGKWETLTPLTISAFFWILAGLLPLAYGGLIEILQENYFPPRTGDWFDFLADAGGVAVSVCLFLLVNLKIKKNESRRRV